MIENKKIQYKLGEDGTAKSFILEVTWTDEYPEVLPEISLDAFYNKHLIPSVKEQILEFAKSEAEQYLGMPMTFTIIEQVKENLENLLKDQPEQIEAPVRETSEEVEVERTNKDTSPKKEILTKAQKRKMWKKGGLNKEAGIGLIWSNIYRKQLIKIILKVDIIKGKINYYTFLMG